MKNEDLWFRFALSYYIKFNRQSCLNIQYGYDNNPTQTCWDFNI
ncbi:hypothetical protein D1AOALGA4SA_7173 [Olavius algarvensis Delta 1 endosymbiont]|nr:hypothetical protein D1AOALGA4SA_7173 [Olavius algarvensis Delta 1 endosymbiont]